MLKARPGLHPDDWTPGPRALEALAAWNHAFSPGDTQAFERRLRWDDLDREEVLRALDLLVFEPDGDTFPQWTHWLDRMFEDGPVLARRFWHDAVLEPAHAEFQKEHPFGELWALPLHVARQALHARLPKGATDHVGPDAWHAFERHLVKEIAVVAEATAFRGFRQIVENHDEGMKRDTREETEHAGDRYLTFVRTNVEAGLVAIFSAYPVLARQIATIIEMWVEATTEFFTRLMEDRPSIASVFNRGTEVGRLTSVETGLSDPHCGRRRVAVLGFETGLRLVYKPRDVAIERIFTDFLAWAVDRGLQPIQKAPRVLDRQGYGWVEHVSNEAFGSAQDVRRYYRQAGGLVCLAHLLRGQDLHMENVVATSEGPVLIDLELLLQPVSAAAEQFTHSVKDAGGPGNAAEACIGTGLLSMIEVSPEGIAYDVGGLRGDGSGALSLPKRVWRDLGSASLHFVEEKSHQTLVKNQVILDGAVMRPDDFPDEILTGFTETHRFVLAHRDQILAADGPLRQFEGAWVRVISRPTNQYAMLSYVLAGPRYQQDGVRQSCAMDVLHRPLNRAVRKPAVWTLVAEERRALEALDVPYFTVRSSDTTVFAGDRPVVSGYYTRSGFDAATARIRALSEEDLAIQLGFLGRSLSGSIRSRFHTDLPASSSRADAHSDAELIGHALWIAQELRSSVSASVPEGTCDLVSASREDRPTACHDLYRGDLGWGLFYAALAVVTSNVEWADAALTTTLRVRQFFQATVPGSQAEGDLVGGCCGLGSIIYALTWIGTLLRDQTVIDAALRVAQSVTPARIAADRELDLVGGSAGAILALLALYHHTGEADLLEVAQACGDHLLASQVPVDPGAAWPSSDGRFLLGFAHGAAGIAYALLRLFRTTRAPSLLEAVKRSQDFQHSLFQPAHGNWPIASPGKEDRVGTGGQMIAWCHGAAGIGLARVFALDVLEDQEVRHEYEAAMRTTATAPIGQVDHLCCGNLGRCDVLLTVGLQTRDLSMVSGARYIAVRVLERARRRQHFGLSGRGYEYRVFDPGFFQGLAGIGYQLLRLAVPSRLPSILAFDAGLVISPENS